MTDLETLATGFDLVEGPTVLPDGSLAFSDVLGGGVYRVDADGDISTLVPKRRGVGGIAVDADGGIVCSGRAVVRVDGGETETIFEADGAFWNNLTVDSGGCIWAGSVRFAVFDPDAEVVPGKVVRLDPEGGVERTLEVGAPVTSVCLTPGGILYVTTAASGGERGSVLLADVGIAGLPVPAATV